MQWNGRIEKMLLYFSDLKEGFSVSSTIFTLIGIKLKWITWFCMSFLQTIYVKWKTLYFLKLNKFVDDAVPLPDCSRKSPN